MVADENWNSARQDGHFNFGFGFGKFNWFCFCCSIWFICCAQVEHKIWEQTFVVIGCTGISVHMTHWNWSIWDLFSMSNNSLEYVEVEFELEYEFIVGLLRMFCLLWCLSWILIMTLCFRDACNWFAQMYMIGDRDRSRSAREIDLKINTKTKTNTESENSKSTANVGQNVYEHTDKKTALLELH
jgi:hypothetical protein